MQGAEDATLMSLDTDPPEFIRVWFLVKAFKLPLHELQSNGEVATVAGSTAPIKAESDNGISAWSCSPGIRK
jgi:hypothetical protein